jgi:hypothetical protein
MKTKEANKRLLTRSKYLVDKPNYNLLERSFESMKRGGAKPPKTTHIIFKTSPFKFDIIALVGQPFLFLFFTKSTLPCWTALDFSWSTLFELDSSLLCFLEVTLLKSFKQILRIIAGDLVLLFDSPPSQLLSDEIAENSVEFQNATKKLI